MNNLTTKEKRLACTLLIALPCAPVIYALLCYAVGVA